MPAVALWTPEDGLLGALAPLGAALAARDSLVIDLDRDGPTYPAERSLADLVQADPTEEDLTPRQGVAVLPNGGIGSAAAADVVTALLERWDRVVLRLPPRPRPDGDVPIVTVRMLSGGWYQSRDATVWQSTADWVPMPSDGIRLPVPTPATVRALLRGHRPPRSRWIDAWTPLWDSV